MPDPLGWAVLIVGALVASVVGGVAGFGAGIVMLPLVSWALGVRSAVPVLTVTMLIGNLSRIWWSRGDIDRAVVVRFALGAVPATALARYALLAWGTAAVGCVLGGTMFAGAWLGRRALQQMSDRVFLGIIEVLLVAMGLHSLLFPR